MEDDTLVQFPGVLPVQDDQPRKRKGAFRTREELRVLRNQLWKLRLEGKTHLEIAHSLNIPLRTVIYNVQASVREIDATRMLEEEMAISLGQLRYIQSVYWEDATGDSEDRNVSAEVWFKAHDRIMKLLGLEAPKRIDVHAEIVAWAEREGLDPQDVIDVTASLLPVPKPPSYSTG